MGLETTHGTGTPWHRLDLGPDPSSPGLSSVADLPSTRARVLGPSTWDPKSGGPPRQHPARNDLSRWCDWTSDGGSAMLERALDTACACPLGYVPPRPVDINTKDG